MFVISYVKNQEGCYELRSRVEETDTPSELVLSSDQHSFYVGCCFDAKPQDIFKCDWQTDPALLNRHCSALNIVNFSETGCAFATDMTGRELLFYYFDGSRFVLSDSFWGILGVVRPGFEDIDFDVVAEMMASGGGVPCDNTTPVKHLYWAPSNMLGVFNASNSTFETRIYDDVKRTGEVASLTEAVDGMDSAMIRMAHYICEKHSGEKLGLGLSGGLDSRVALHYFQGEGANLVCFNTCVSRPHGLFEAASVRNARALARDAGVDLAIVEWHPETIREKLDRMLEYQPFGTCGHFTNAYKYEEEGMPSFDVLIAGGQTIGPALVGVSAARNSDSMTEEDVQSYLYNLCIGEVRPYSYSKGLVQGKLASMGVGHGQDRGASFWNAIVEPRVYASIRDRVDGFVSERWEKGWRPADITMDYRTSALGAIGRNGAYESRLGEVKGYSIYTPFLVNEGLRWDISLIEDRLVLKELIKRKMPNLASVGEETYGATNSSGSKLFASASKVNFLLRGSGIMADEWYAKHPAIKQAFAEDMNSGCHWFYESFPAAGDEEIVWGLSPSRRNSVWELKRLIDCIESERYLEFL